MKYLLLCLVCGIAAELPPMPNINSRGCGNAQAILFVRQIRYINVLKDFLQQKNVEIQDADFKIKIAQINIEGLKSILDLSKIIITSYSSKLEDIKSYVKDLQSQFPDVKKVSGAAFCRAKYALSMIPPMKFASENTFNNQHYMDYAHFVAYSTALTQLRSCNSQSSVVSLDDMVSDSLKSKTIVDETKKDFKRYYRGEFINGMLAQFRNAIGELAPALSSLKESIDNIQGEIKAALAKMNSYVDAMKLEHQKMEENRAIINGYVASIEAQKQIIKNAADDIAVAKDKITELVDAINRGVVNSGMFKACPKWLESELKKI